MKYTFAILVGILAFITSSYVMLDEENDETKLELSGSSWTANFFFYRNVYEFETGNKGVCYEHQQASMCPIDLEKHNIAEDSMLLMREIPFEYASNNGVLTITFASIDGESIPEREFDIVETADRGFQLTSKYEYAYGREVLFPVSPLLNYNDK